MVEKYSLNGKQLPTLPTPHDCKIIEVEFKDEYLIFNFDNGITLYDSIKKINPDANSLVIKYHLNQPEVCVYKYKPRFNGKAYELVNNKKLIKKHTNLQFWYQYVTYNQIILKLFSDVEIFVKFECDYIEYEWL